MTTMFSTRFFRNRFDVGPVRLASIVHAFNYRVAVLWDGAAPALRIGSSRRAEHRFLDNVDISWDQQVVIMFKIVISLHLHAFNYQKLAVLSGWSSTVHCESSVFG